MDIFTLQGDKSLGLFEVKYTFGPNGYVRNVHFETPFSIIDPEPITFFLVQDHGTWKLTDYAVTLDSVLNDIYGYKEFHKLDDYIGTPIGRRMLNSFLESNQCCFDPRSNSIYAIDLPNDLTLLSKRICMFTQCLLQVGGLAAA